jgi:Uma2 family endonuclease
MGVMAAEGKRTAKWEEVPPESVSFRRLLDLLDRVDTGKPNKAEVIDEQVVVSPVPVYWHEEVCQWLLLSFLEVCAANDWAPDTVGEIQLPRTRNVFVPDLVILRDKKSLPRLERFRPLDRVLLAAEVISPSSIRQDREVKPRACALAGIPLYLLVDRFTKPVTISLHSEPGKDGYATVTTVTAGEKLPLPAPLSLTLDTSSLPLLA